ncbi:MAG: HAD-IIB family hydrolase [Acidimicrobiia bacterium]
MRRRLIAFDLDGTLAETKSPVSEPMARLLEKLLTRFEVCVISGGKFEQFKVQLIDRLHVGPDLLSRLHVMPTSGARYLRYDLSVQDWVVQYADDLPIKVRAEVAGTLVAAAESLGYWEPNPSGAIIEDRGSQITFSALGQEATADRKFAWDPTGTKKLALRDYVARELPDFEVRVGGTTSIDVTRTGIDKAYGMRRLMDHLGISKGEILFFGDKLERGGNDYPAKALGIDTIAVENWQGTALAIQSILAISDGALANTATPDGAGLLVAFPD